MLVYALWFCGNLSTSPHGVDVRLTVLFKLCYIATQLYNCHYLSNIQATLARQEQLGIEYPTDGKSPNLIVGLRGW